MTDSDSAVVVLDAADNVGVARRGLRCGETAGGAEVRDDIPKGHKVALASVSAGQAVKKFGQPIGEAAQDIQAGQHIHTHNLACRGGGAASVLRRQTSAHLLPEAERETFMGFRRPDGRAGRETMSGCFPASTARRPPRGWSPRISLPKNFPPFPMLTASPHSSMAAAAEWTRKAREPQTSAA